MSSVVQYTNWFGEDSDADHEVLAFKRFYKEKNKEVLSDKVMCIIEDYHDFLGKNGWLSELPPVS